MSIIINVANIAKAATKTIIGAAIISSAVTPTGKREPNHSPEDVFEARKAQRNMIRDGQKGLQLVFVDGVVEDPYKPDRTVRRIGSFNSIEECIQRLVLVRERYGYTGRAFVVDVDMMIRISEDAERKIYETQDPAQREQKAVFPWEVRDWTFRKKKAPSDGNSDGNQD